MKHLSHAPHITAYGEVIIKGIQEARARLELVVNGEPGDIGSARDRLHSQVGFRLICKEFAGGVEDASACLAGGSFALAHVIGTRRHNLPCILSYSVYK